ncbi:response regulator transcription factor [Silvimonas sp. JCM 19000]
MIRVILADDHPLAIGGAEAIISSSRHISIVATCNDPDQVFVELDKVSCDVLVTDYSMPGSSQGDGLSYLRFIARRYPATKIVLLTMIANPLSLTAAEKSGVSALVSKLDKLDVLIPAIDAAYVGKRYRSPAMQALFDKVESEARGNETITKVLSSRECEVMRMIVEGFTITEIAEKLHRSIKTISTQKRTAMHKLGVSKDADIYKFDFNLSDFKLGPE